MARRGSRSRPAGAEGKRRRPAGRAGRLVIVQEPWGSCTVQLRVARRRLVLLGGDGDERAFSALKHAETAAEELAQDLGIPAPIVREERQRRIPSWVQDDRDPPGAPA